MESGDEKKKKQSTQTNKLLLTSIALFSWLMLYCVMPSWKKQYDREANSVYDLISRTFKQRLTPTDLRTSHAGRSSEPAPEASLRPDRLRSLPSDLAPCESSGGRDGPTPDAQRGEGGFLSAQQLQGGTQRSGRCLRVLCLSPKISRRAQQEVEYWLISESASELRL